MTRVHRHYSEIVDDVAEDMGQRRWGEDDLSSLESRDKEFKKMVRDAFDEHCDSGLYTLKYHLLENMVEEIKRFETLSNLDGNA